jgi:hypothetical protein
MANGAQGVEVWNGKRYVTAEPIDPDFGGPDCVLCGHRVSVMHTLPAHYFCMDVKLKPESVRAWRIQG